MSSSGTFLREAARAEEDRQRISSHAENRTSNHTGKQKKTLYRRVGVPKVMSTHSERRDILYLISTACRCDSPALIWSHVSRILNPQKNISHREGARRRRPLWRRASLGIEYIEVSRSQTDKSRLLSLRRETTESGRAEAKAAVSHSSAAGRQGSADTNWTRLSSAVPSNAARSRIKAGRGSKVRSPDQGTL